MAMEELVEIVNLTLNLLQETLEANACLVQLMQTLEEKNELLQRRLSRHAVNLSSRRTYSRKKRFLKKLD